MPSGTSILEPVKRLSNLGAREHLDHVRNDLTKLLLANLRVHKRVGGRQGLVEQSATKCGLLQFSFDPDANLGTQCQHVKVISHLSFGHRSEGLALANVALNLGG